MERIRSLKYERKERVPTKMRKPKAKPPPENSKIIFPGEELSKLTIPELILLMKTILQEIETRAMENA